MMNLPGVFAFAKDRHGKYTYASEAYAEAANMDSPQQLIGLTDFDMPWCQQASELLADDKRVLSGHLIKGQREIITINDRIVTVITSKKFDEKNQCILGISHEIINAELGQFTIDTEKQVVKLGPAYNNIQLKRAQLETLKLICTSRNSEELANKLGLTIKGAEHRIKALKAKFNCEKKADLISLCMKNNLSQLLSQSINW